MVVLEEEAVAGVEVAVVKDAMNSFQIRVSRETNSVQIRYDLNK